MAVMCAHLMNDAQSRRTRIGRPTGNFHHLCGAK
jgi:hypothetical protein